MRWKKCRARKVDSEVLLYEGSPVAVHTLGKLDGLLLALVLRLQPAHFFLKWRIDEHMERIRVIAQIVSRAAPYDHRVALGGRLPGSVVSATLRMPSASAIFIWGVFTLPSKLPRKKAFKRR